jgi:hypothetical protein
MTHKHGPKAFTAPGWTFFFGMLLLVCGGPPGLAASDPRDDVEARYRARVEAIEQRHNDRIGSDAFFRRFRPLVEALGLPPERQPTNLFDLSNALGARPDLMPEFMRLLDSPLASSAARRDTSINSLMTRLSRRLERMDLRLGPRADTSRGDYVEALLQTLDPEKYGISGPYEPKPPAVIRAVTVELNPLTFESAQIQDLNADGTPFDIYCLNTPKCEWPAAYDLTPPQVYLFWRSPTLGIQQLKDIVAEQGYALSLTLNGKMLIPGPQVPYGKPASDPGQGYWAMAMETPTGNYIATVLLASDVLQVGELPWEIQLSVYEAEPLDVPELIGIDENGNPQFAYAEYFPFAEPKMTFDANPTNSQSYFEAMLYPTFQSDRCTDCHGFGTIEKLAEHHKNDPNDFVKYTGAHLEESAYDPPNHVIVCQSCHHLQTVDEHGNQFAEIEWKAPHADLDINWKLKTAAETCDRVIHNLPTHVLRHEHFHLDARLFWAIEQPYVVGRFLPPPAEPGDFDEFLRRVDTWNDAGAPCP